MWMFWHDPVHLYARVPHDSHTLHILNVAFMFAQEGK